MFRFTIRDMLRLTAAGGLARGWRARLSREKRRHHVAARRQPPERIALESGLSHARGDTATFEVAPTRSAAFSHAASYNIPMRFRLRTLLILLAVGPPMLAGAWFMAPRRSPLHGIKGTARVQVAFLDDAVKLYCLHTGELPPDLQALITPPANLAYPQHWSGPYVEQNRLPVDPWNNAYQYKVIDEKENDFQIWSRGPDGRTPSKDDIFAMQ